MAEAEREGYLHMLARCCRSGCYAAFAAALCGAVHAKLCRGMESYLARPALFGHALDEAAAFELELRNLLASVAFCARHEDPLHEELFDL